MKRFRILVVLASLSAGCFSPAHAAYSSLTFITPVNLPDIGLRVKLMPDARETPPSPPRVYYYRLKQGDQEWKEERYAPADLWRAKQMVGQWKGRFGNTLALAIISSRLPQGFKSTHVTRDIYEDGRTNDVRTSGAPFPNAEDITEWVHHFTGCSNAVAERVASPSSRVDPVIRFKLTPAVSNRVAYAFRLNRNAGHTSSPSWICATYDICPDIPMSVACRAIEKEFLTSLSFSAISEPPALSSATPPTGPKSRPGETEDMMAVRQQVAESIRNLKGWWYDASPHYIILSNLKGNTKLMVEQLRKAMDAIRPAYTRCIPEPAGTVVSVIRMPATPEEYVTYVGADHAWTGGMWIPDRKELLIRPSVDKGSQDKRHSLFRLAFHEGFHQYAFYAMNQADTAVWFNEGYAQLFENAVIANGRIRIDEDQHALTLLPSLLAKGGADLDRLLHLTHEQFYDRDDAVRASNYALAWALVYYLKKGAGSDPKSPFAGLLDKYVAAMREKGQGGAEATATMMEGVDVQRLSQDFVRFWHSTARQAAVRRYDPFVSRTSGNHL